MKTLIERAIEIQRQLEEVKPLYKELDSITMELVQSGATEFEYGNVKVELIDNFKDKNTCFKVAGVKRWELKFKP